jgi:hypothetical protein
MKIPASNAIQFVRGNGAPLTHKRILPNDPCPCGSGKKVKHCCGVNVADKGYYYSRLTDEQLDEVKKKREADRKRLN